MEGRLRRALVVVPTLLAGCAFGQAPYTLNVFGQLTNCAPGQMVNVQTLPGTLPAQSVAVPVDVECNFHAVLGLSSSTGGVFAFSSCSNGTSTGDSSSFSFANGDTATVILDLACSTAGDLQACLNIAQAAPFTAQFTSCTSGGATPYTCVWLMPDGTVSVGDNISFTFSQPGIYGICMQASDATGSSSVACDTVYVANDGSINNAATTPPCQAGFWVLQAYTDTSGGSGIVSPVPNEVWVVDLSLGNAGMDQYDWDFGDGTGSTENYPTHVYQGPGPWELCLTIFSGNCTSTFCDSVSVDEDGYLNGLVLDGHGATAGVSTDSRSGGFTLNVVPTLPVGIQESTYFNNLELWPNPVRDMLNISLGSRITGKVPMAIMDLTGRTVLSSVQPLASGRNTLQLSTEHLASGLYVVRIGLGQGQAAVRFLKMP